MSVLLFDGPAARGFTRAGGDVGKTSADLRWLRGDCLGRAELRLEHHFGSNTTTLKFNSRATNRSAVFVTSEPPSLVGPFKHVDVLT